MKRIFVLIAAVFTAVIASIGLSTGVASAWHPVISGQTTCISNGTWTVEWTVANSESGAGSVMSFDSAEVNGVPISLSPSSVAPSGSASGTSTQSAATSTATLVVDARWANSEETASRSASVDRPADCVPPTTTTTVPPTTTTTEAPTTTAVAPVTTAAPAVTTTVAQVDDTAVAPVPVPVTPQAPQVEAVSITAAVSTDQLPATGTVSFPLVVAGISTLLVGIGLVLVARRRGAAI